MREATVQMPQERTDHVANVVKYEPGDTPGGANLPRSTKAATSGGVTMITETMSVRRPVLGMSSARTNVMNVVAVTASSAMTAGTGWTSRPAKNVAPIIANATTSMTFRTGSGRGRS